MSCLISVVTKADVTLSRLQLTKVDIYAEGRCRQKLTTRDRRPGAVPMSTIVNTFKITKKFKTLIRPPGLLE